MRLTVVPDRNKLRSACFDMMSACVECDIQVQILGIVGVYGVSAADVFRCRQVQSGSINDCVDALKRAVPRVVSRSLSRGTERIEGVYGRMIEEPVGLVDLDQLKEDRLLKYFILVITLL